MPIIIIIARVYSSPSSPPTPDCYSLALAVATVLSCYDSCRLYQSQSLCRSDSSVSRGPSFHVFSYTTTRYVLHNEPVPLQRRPLHQVLCPRCHPSRWRSRHRILPGHVHREEVCSREHSGAAGLRQGGRHGRCGGHRREEGVLPLLEERQVPVLRRCAQQAQQRLRRQRRSPRRQWKGPVDTAYSIVNISCYTPDCTSSDCNPVN